MAVNAVNFGNPLSINIPTKMIINRNDSNKITSVDFVLPDSDGRQFSYSEVAGKNLDTLQQQGYFDGIQGGAKYLLNNQFRSLQDKPLIIMDALGMLKPPTEAEAQTKDFAYVKQADDAWAAKWAPNNPTAPPGIDPAFYERWKVQHGYGDQKNAGNTVSSNVSANNSVSLNTTSAPSSDNSSVNLSSTEGQSTNTNYDMGMQTKLAALAYKNAAQYTSQALNTIMDMA